MERITIGSMCKSYRQKLFLTQEEMAAKLGISRPAYHAIENGKNKRFRYSTLRKISMLLNVEPEKLLQIIK